MLRLSVPAMSDVRSTECNSYQLEAGVSPWQKNIHHFFVLEGRTKTMTGDIRFVDNLIMYTNNIINKNIRKM